MKAIITKVIIHENERGFLFKNGTYRRMLQPGKHRVLTFLGETFARTAIDKQINVPGTTPEVLMRDGAFGNNVVKIDVPDGYVGVRFENGRVAGVLEAGRYFYFNFCGEPNNDGNNNGNGVTFKLFDISKVEIEGLTSEQISRLPQDAYQKITVGESETGLLFLDGKFSRALTAGAYYFWNTKTAVTCEKVDLRSQELEINGQEILTADKGFVARELCLRLPRYGRCENYRRDKELQGTYLYRCTARAERIRRQIPFRRTFGAKGQYRRHGAGKTERAARRVLCRVYGSRA